MLLRYIGFPDLSFPSLIRNHIPDCRGPMAMILLICRIPGAFIKTLICHFTITAFIRTFIHTFSNRFGLSETFQKRIVRIMPLAKFDRFIPVLSQYFTNQRNLSWMFMFRAPKYPGKYH